MKLFDVYPLYDVKPVWAKDVYVYDEKGSEYLDLYRGHAVISIGHSHEHYVSSIQEQLQQIEVKADLVKSEKYDTLFTVDTLNEWVKSGMPFRTAYQKMGEQVADGSYQANRKLEHTHLGSIGNLAITEIRKKMKLLDQG